MSTRSEITWKDWCTFSGATDKPRDVLVPPLSQGIDLARCDALTVAITVTNVTGAPKLMLFTSTAMGDTPSLLVDFDMTGVPVRRTYRLQITAGAITVGGSADPEAYGRFLTWGVMPDAAAAWSVSFQIVVIPHGDLAFGSPSELFAPPPPDIQEAFYLEGAFATFTRACQSPNGWVDTSKMDRFVVDVNTMFVDGCAFHVQTASQPGPNGWVDVSSTGIITEGEVSYVLTRDAGVATELLLRNYLRWEIKATGDWKAGVRITGSAS